MASRLQGALDEARQRAGLPPLQNAAPATAAAPAPDTRPADGAAAGAASVQVRITLAPALAAKASPDDTLFVFARAPQGGKAPLAIQRRQVKDLPLDVTLDDSMAMSPAMRLSSVPQVIVGARISKSGNAMPQPGDLQGLSPVVPVGTQGLALQIAEVLP
jgi:cytochrome c-type biogenesis protein CcmH